MLADGAVQLHTILLCIRRACWLVACWHAGMLAWLSLQEKKAFSNMPPYELLRGLRTPTRIQVHTGTYGYILIQVQVNGRGLRVEVVTPTADAGYQKALD